MFAFYTQSSAQCAGCIINSACTATPVEPALCPDVLPDGMQGAPYDMDVTFFIPQQFYNASAGLTVTLSQITITSVSGLPSGLSWTASEADNIFDITSDPLSQRGCVKICGTPDAIGSYTIAVNVIASVSAPISTTAPQTFTLPLLILPGGGGNSGFSFDPSSGCDSVLVNFQALITSSSQPVNYTWDFGNGNTSTEFVPAAQLYNVPDTYTVSLQTDLLNYVLQDVTFNATGSNWCGDVEEPSIPFFGTCTGDPDIYFQFTVGSSTQQSATIDNSTSFSQSGLTYVINEPSFSLSFFDEDVITSNDNLGTAIFQVTSPGTFNFNTNEGYGSYTIGTQVGLSFINTDSVIVFASPASPVIQFSDSLACAGDSILLFIDPAPFQQWYADSTQLFGSNGSSITTTSSGAYQVEVRNDAGCVAFSAFQNVLIANNPEVPSVFFNPITGALFSNPGAGLNWIWLLDGVMQSGSENLVSLEPTVPGNYAVIVENASGCSAQSANVFYTNVGLNEAPERLKFRVYPQPWNSGSITLDGVESAAQVSLFDASGRQLFNQFLPGAPAQQLEFPNLSAGVYFLKVHAEGQEGTRLFMVAH